MKAVYLGKCLQIFDETNSQYVKLSAKNLRKALKLDNTTLSRREIIQRLKQIIAIRYS
jgi:hypothetical protein